MTAPRIVDQGKFLIVAAQWKNEFDLEFSELRCYDAGGEIDWTFSPASANGSIFSEPAMSSDGTIFILTYRDYSAYLFAIDPDGKELWNKSISFSDSWYGTVSYATLRVSIDLDGSLYLTIGNSLHALDVNGQERWVYPEISGAASVGIGEDHLFVVDDSGVYLHILTKEGEWIASYFCGNGRYIFGTPCVLPGDNVILTLWLGGVEIVNSTGVRVWDYQLADGASYKAVVDEQGTIYFIVNKDESSPSLMAIGERDLEADILAWEIIWVLSIIFSSVMLLMFIHSFRSIRDADEKGRGSRNQGRIER